MCWSLPLFAVLLLSACSAARPLSSGDEQDGGGKAAVTEEVMKKAVDEAMEELKLAEELQEMTNSTRESRGLLKKVAFLAGMKVGGMVQSSGTLAASNTMRIFGKVVNSALSVSYGTIDDLSPVPGVHEHPVIEVQKNKDLPQVDDVATAKVMNLEETSPQSFKAKEEELHRKIKSNFIGTHNDLVDRANHNSKYSYFRVSREKVHVKDKSQ